MASVLPGLRYALQKATSSSWGDSAGTRIKQHFQEYAKLRQNTQPTSGHNSKMPSSLPSPTEDEWTNPFRRHSERSLSQLRSYLSNPSSYTLELAAAVGCLTGAAQSLHCDLEGDYQVESSGPPPDPIPPKAAVETKAKGEIPTVGLEQHSEGPTKDTNSSSKLWVQQGKRKSSQAVVTSTRKKWSPLKMQMHPVGDGGRKRKTSKKKKINITFSFPKKPGLVANSNEPMLKLANLQFPHRRKRGAEVLSAEFVHKTQAEPVQKETSAPGDPSWEAKRPKAPKNPELNKVPAADTVTKPVKRKALKTLVNSPRKPAARKQADVGQKEPSGDVPSRARGRAAELPFHPKGEDYESHALNLLADLALGSCVPSFISGAGGMVPVACSPSGDPEQQSHPKDKSLPVGSDHRYHRLDELAKEAASPSKASLEQQLPPAEKTDFNALASIPSGKKPGISRPKPSPTELPPEPQEAAEASRHPDIAAEHSYASLVPEQHSKKHLYPRGTPYPGSAPSRNGTRSTRVGPLVGKVLPFRHQQNSSQARGPFQAVAGRRRRGPLSTRLKENFGKCHDVNVCGESLKVTCHWEAEYHFHLDSRYTNDALEKTVIRALHGPWDPDLPDDLEEMKLILHMWVALFYSKPSTLPGSVRKVVEHRNPEKYVSINSTGDFFELSDDGEDCFGLETYPADSWSDPDQTPSSSLDLSTSLQGSFQPEESPADSQTDADGTPGVVDSTVSSSSGELPCEEEEEPSSTSCPESLSLTHDSLAVTHGQPVDVHEVSTITVEELPKEGLADAAVSPSPSDDLSDANKPSVALGKENPGCSAPNSSTAPWSDAPCVLPGGREQQERGWPAGPGGGSRTPEDMESMGVDPGYCVEVEDSGWATSNRSQRASHLVPLETSPGSAKSSGAGGESEESQEHFGHPEKEEGEVEEGKKEKEDSEDGSTVLGTLDLSLSESSSANVEHEEREKGENSGGPKDFGLLGESPVPIPSASASPWRVTSTPLLPSGTGTCPQALPGEMAPSLDMLQQPCQALGSPGAGTNGCGLAPTASPGSPCDSRLVLSPSDPSLVSRVQPDSATGSSGSAGETSEDGLEQKDKDHAERWMPAGREAASTASLEPPSSQGLSPTLSPDSSCVCRAALDGAADPGAAPEDEEAGARIQTPSQSGLAGSSCCPQRCGGDTGADLASPSDAESSQEGRKVLVAEQNSSPSTNHAEGLEESSGDAGQGLGFSFNCTALAGDSEAGEGRATCLGAEESPVGEKVSAVMVASTPETSPQHPLQSQPCSLVTEGVSATKEHPRQQQSSPNSLSPPAHGGSAAASAPQQDPLPQGSEQGPILPWKPCQQVGAAEVSVVPESPDGSLKPRCAEEMKKDRDLCQAEPAESCPGGVLVPGAPGSLPPPPLHGHRAGHITELDSTLGLHPETCSPRMSLDPGGAPRSCCASPEGQAADVGIHEDLEGGSCGPVASPASLPAEELLVPQPFCSHGEHEGSKEFAAPPQEVGEGEIPVLSIPADAHKRLSGEILELSDTRGLPAVLPPAEQLPSKHKHLALASEDPLQPFCRASDRDHPGWTPHSLLTPRASPSTSSAGRTKGGSPWASSEARGEDGSSRGRSWAELGGHLAPYVSIQDSQGLSRLFQNFVVTKKCQERTGKGHGRRTGLPPWVGTRRGCEETTQRTLDTECLRFHCKLKQILRSGRPPSSTSTSIFPQDSSPWDTVSETLSPGSRSPLRVTILPSGLGRQRGDLVWDEGSGVSPPPSTRGRAAPPHLGRLRYERKARAGRGDAAEILGELGGVVLSGAEGRGGVVVESGEAAACEEMIAQLCGALRSRLRSLAEEACGQPGMFYLVQTGQEPFFDRVKALLRKGGHMEMEPQSFCEAQQQDSGRLLVVIRNKDISSHIHNVPCLLQLKHCPNVVFAGVDNPEDLTGHLYQELFHAGGFVVSDEEVLETVTLGQLKELVKVLENLNRNGRWKWLLHYKESKKLREDIRLDPNARKKQLLLQWCQGAELVETLHYHGCDATASPGAQRLPCLLTLQVQRVGTRFAVFLTEKPGASRELLESKGILVADVEAFVGTVQKAAAPFQRTYW